MREYYRTLRHQMRELVDLRKMEYEPSKGLVLWFDYKRPQRERFTVDEFLDGMAEYAARLGAWGDEEESQALHRQYR